MTQKEQIKYLLRRKPELKFSRGEFMWAWIEEMFGVNVGITKSQFLEFWKQEAGVERALRDVLREKEFSLPINQDSKRYEKSAGFKEEYKKTK